MLTESDDKQAFTHFTLLSSIKYQYSKSCYKPTSDSTYDTY